MPSEFKANARHLVDGLDSLGKSIFNSAVKGVGAALLQLKADMILQQPTAPIDEGFLRGSTSIFVQNKEVEQPPEAKEKVQKRLHSHTESIDAGQIVGVIGVNVPYAARHHEVPAHFQEPSAGNKYLESKMANNKNTYKKIIVNTINKEAKV